MDRSRTRKIVQLLLTPSDHWFKLYHSIDLESKLYYRAKSIYQDLSPEDKIEPELCIRDCNNLVLYVRCTHKFGRFIGSAYIIRNVDHSRTKKSHNHLFPTSSPQNLLLPPHFHLISSHFLIIAIMKSHTPHI